jgi:hypothetical protein
MKDDARGIFGFIFFAIYGSFCIWIAGHTNLITAAVIFVICSIVNALLCFSIGQDEEDIKKEEVKRKPEPIPKYKIGDVVILNSDDEPMTIGALRHLYDDEYQTYLCYWLDYELKMTSCWFMEPMLTLKGE